MPTTSLLQKLPQSVYGLQGQTPQTPVGATANSKLHDTYSINNIPNVSGKPNPSTLDLDGITPPKYLDNPPQ